MGARERSADSSETDGTLPADLGRSSERELVGRVIGKYEIGRAIGGGGMGRVYEGINTAIGKRVALKFIDKEEASADAVARFQREAQAASAVESAHIVEIFDAGQTDDGMPFIVMELLRGEDLGHRIRRLGKLDTPEALLIASQILRGLHRAHEAGIVHRDLKPDNVFLLDRDDGQTFAKIVDFGVSKISKRGSGRSTTITQEGTILGTPLYMSPEQAQAQSDVDGRSDIYSVGAILFEMLAGRPPHSGATYEQVIVNICMKDAADVRTHNDTVPAGVSQVIAKALSRDREARYESAAAFLDALIESSEGMLTGRSLSNSDVRDKGHTVIRSDRSSSGSKTLGAVSTVAAAPPNLGTTDRREKSHLRSYLIGGGVGLAAGAAVFIYVFLNAGATVPSTSDPQRVILVAPSGSPPGSADTRVAAESTPASASTPAPSASVNGAPSASASTTVDRSMPTVDVRSSASATASAKKPPRVGTGAPDLHILK